MTRKPSQNTQLFALPAAPPSQLNVAGSVYRLDKVFKHDFFAATTLYERTAGDGPVRIVVKFGREQHFCGLGGAWIGRLLLQRERKIHRRLDGIPGVQPWVAQLSETAYALEYIEGDTLDYVALPLPATFFDSLRELIDRVHARGVAYVDMNKRSNIIVQPDGQAGLIDFQISTVQPLKAGSIRRRWIAYLQRMDLRHIYKHKRRFAPDAMSPEETELVERRGALLRLHRTLFTPLRKLRRRFLSRRHKAGKLVSPTEHLESHDQPEKETWRDPDTK